MISKAIYSYPVVKLFCSQCGEPLIMDDPGCWYCDHCVYWEINNVTECQSDWCDRLVISKTDDFYYLEDNYCQIIDSINNYTCLNVAQAASDAFDEECDRLDEHMENCTDDDCDCKNV